LVGVNEAGKTALLKALQQINAPKDAELFSALRDYPRSQYIEVQRGEKNPSDVCVVEAAFELTEAERQLVLDESPTSAGVTELIIYRYLDNSLHWNFGPSVKLWASFGEIDKDLARLRAHIAKQDSSTEVLDELDVLIKGRRLQSPVRNEFARDLLAWLNNALLLIDESNQTEEKRFGRIKEAAELRERVIAAGKAVRARLPLFVYYSTYFTVRPRINRVSLAAREQTGDLDTERLVREALSDCPRADDLMLAVTELTTNGISHSASGQGGSFTVRLRTAPSWARIEDTDDGPAAGDPSPRNGWGLAIVAGVTDRASAVIQPDGCRTAWCDVSWPSPEPDGQLARLSESLTAEHGPVSRGHLAEARAAWPDADKP
jgi:hypothetical protein